MACFKRRKLTFKLYPAKSTTPRMTDSADLPVTANSKGRIPYGRYVDNEGSRGSRLLPLWPGTLAFAVLSALIFFDPEEGRECDRPSCVRFFEDAERRLARGWASATAGKACSTCTLSWPAGAGAGAAACRCRPVSWTQRPTRCCEAR